MDYASKLMEAQAMQSATSRLESSISSTTKAEPCESRDLDETLSDYVQDAMEVGILKDLPPIDSNSDDPEADYQYLKLLEIVDPLYAAAWNVGFDAGIDERFIYAIANQITNRTQRFMDDHIAEGVRTMTIQLFQQEYLHLLMIQKLQVPEELSDKPIEEYVKVLERIQAAIARTVSTIDKLKRPKKNSTFIKNFVQAEINQVREELQSGQLKPCSSTSTQINTNDFLAK